MKKTASEECLTYKENTIKEDYVEMSQSLLDLTIKKKK